MAEGSSAAVVRTAWRRAVRLYHPDHAGGGDLDRFLAVNDAYRALEAGFAPLRGAHPVDVDELAMAGGASPAGTSAPEADPFDFLDGPPPAADPDPTPEAAAPDDLPEPVDQRPEAGADLDDLNDLDAVFDAAIDRAMGTTPERRSWRRQARGRSQSRTIVAPASPAPPAPPAVPSDGELTADGGAHDAPEPGRAIAEAISGIELPTVAPSALVAAAGGVAFVGMRLALQAAVPTSTQVPLPALVAVGLVVAALCWFVASRFVDGGAAGDGGVEGSPVDGPDPASNDAKVRSGITSILVVIFCAVDILLLVAVPILLVGAVAYAVTRQRGTRR